ncbi:MAG: ribbon-helix-helix domain-containing protein [Acidobacteria bacterium]|jgi:hypothetical protein|nr:ribbon-helix-helix domain-containing protein [Acidobacteriota bacterium]
MRRFLFAIEATQHQELKEAAARQGVSASELVRRGISAVLAVVNPREDQKCTLPKSA